MNNEPYRLEDSKQTKMPDKKWYQIEVIRELSTNVPVMIARDRLQLAFASNIAISKGLLLASYKYSGRLDGNNLDVDFTISGRSQMNYHLKGQIFEDANGSGLKLSIRMKNPFLLAFVFILFPVIIFPKSFVMILIMMCFLVPLNFAVMYWHCNAAANSVTNLLNKIITNQPHNS